MVGQSWGEIMAAPLGETKDHNVIRTVDNPVREEGGIAILYGNLAPEGAIVKTSAIPQEMLIFRGKARVFDSEAACGIAFADGTVERESVLVIRYEGPKGDPGMREIHRLTEFAASLGPVALVTDGRFSGASSGLANRFVQKHGMEVQSVWLRMEIDHNPYSQPPA